MFQYQYKVMTVSKPFFFLKKYKHKAPNIS